MKRIALIAATAALIARPTVAEPFREFTDVRTRATNGTSVIRAFPNATTPSFRLLLERPRPDYCIVWIEFPQRAGTINHFGQYGKGDANGTLFTRRALVEGPLFNDDSLSSDGSNNFAKSFLDDQHWVAVATNDALNLVTADVDLDANGNCVAGTRTEFTSNLAYRDVVDGNRLDEFGEVRLRGFPSANPTFAIFLEFAEAGRVIEPHQGGGGQPEITLPGDACIMWLEFGPDAFPLYTPSGFEPNSEDRIDLLAFVDGGLPPGTLGQGISWPDTLPFISRSTGQTIRIVDGQVSLNDGECSGRARLQFAPRITPFYR